MGSAGVAGWSVPLVKDGAVAGDTHEHSKKVHACGTFDKMYEVWSLLEGVNLIVDGDCA